MTRITSYIESLDPGLPEKLQRLEEEARQKGVPVIRSETQFLLRFLIQKERSERILEVGSGTGFSALLMWESSGKTARIDTIEKNEKRAREAEEHFGEFGADSVKLLFGDAADILPVLSESYDLIFMDAAKGQYPAFLPQVLRLLKSGGLLVSDNVLQGGMVLESRYAVERRDRTIHGRMRDYLYTLTHHEELNSVILQGGDGVALSYKKDR
ncbi:MAG: O-methyltransferase [Lachnospiraceae bacterium]|nr:O-methyltransferase [Lachnospiraceae bacterium]